MRTALRIAFTALALSLLAPVSGLAQHRTVDLRERNDRITEQRVRIHQFSPQRNEVVQNRRAVIDRTPRTLSRSPVGNRRAPIVMAETRAKKVQPITAAQIEAMQLQIAHINQQRALVRNQDQVQKTRESAMEFRSYTMADLAGVNLDPDINRVSQRDINRYSKPAGKGSDDDIPSIQAGGDNPPRPIRRSSTRRHN